MPEEDAKIFAEAYNLFDKWRGTEIHTLDQWCQLTNEVYDFVVEHVESRLALRLAIGIMDTFDDLYKDGQKPPMPDYFGRSDL